MAKKGYFGWDGSTTRMAIQPPKPLPTPMQLEARELDKKAREAMRRDIAERDTKQLRVILGKG